jgi:hypothetical protein
MKCQQCHHEFAAGEPVYRVAVGYGGNDYRLFGGAIGSICAGCALATREYRTSDGRLLTSPVHWDQQWRAAEPCVHCSRPVVLSGRRRRPRYVICGERCRSAVYAQSRRRRRRERREVLSDM